MTWGGNKSGKWSLTLLPDLLGHLSLMYLQNVIIIESKKSEQSNVYDDFQLMPTGLAGFDFPSCTSFPFFVGDIFILNVCFYSVHDMPSPVETSGIRNMHYPF